MALEHPVLQYAQGTSASADRYRLAFLLAGLPGVLVLLLPIGGAPSVGMAVFGNDTGK